MRSDIVASINYTSPFTLYNMVTKFDIYCAPKLNFMLFGTSTMIGHLIFLIWFSHLIDIKGRKNVILGSLGVLGMSVGGMMIVPGYFPKYSIYLIYLLLVAHGVAGGIIGL
jgi:MFS family permease